jgi:hypothetical protein
VVDSYQFPGTVILVDVEQGGQIAVADGLPGAARNMLRQPYTAGRSPAAAKR